MFIDLARKARSLPDDVLPGWLHRHTCFTAATAVRTERRRQSREQTAMEMKAMDDNSEATWHKWRPCSTKPRPIGCGRPQCNRAAFLEQKDFRPWGRR